MQTEPQSTAMELLDQFPATKLLKKFGFTNELLGQTRFHLRDRLLPIAQRPVHLPAALLNGWKLTEEGRPPVLSLIRDYVIYRYALIDGFCEDSHHRSEAWQHVSERLYEPLVDARIKYLDEQRAKSRLPRGRIPEIQMTMREFAMEYAQKPENRLSSPREMWPGFGEHMRFHRLDAKLVRDTYEYLDTSIAFGTFCNHVRAARKQRSQ
jgi:hypothetical protein